MIPSRLCGPQEARKFALLASLSLGLIMFHSNANAARLAAPKNHRMISEEGDAELARRSDEPTIGNSNSSAPSSGDIIISSLEAEHKFGKKLIDKRHRYEQHQALEWATDNQIDETGASAGSAANQDEQPSSERQQIQARNEQETVQLSEQQQQLADQIIIDHRPSSGAEMGSPADQFGSSTQTPPTSSTSSPPSTQASVQTALSTASPFGQQSVANSNAAPFVPGQPQVQWIQPAASSQQAVYARQAQPSATNNNNQQQQQQFGNMMSASNQVMSSVQYPTSINSIISDQQQATGQQQQQQQQPMGQFQTQIVNGQQQLVFVPQNGASSNLNSQVIGMAPNGRRMSISNWLRGLGSMLSNIFYRREHGALSSAQTQAGGVVMQASGSAPSGSWIQLGPSAPHWLTQAQSAIQQFQQQHQQLVLPVSSRFGGFLSASTGPSQQQQAASTNTITIALPQQPVNSAQQQQMGDLQTSGSANSYVTVQAPASMAAVATNQQLNQQSQPQQQQQQQHQSNVNTQQQTVLIGQLQAAAVSNGSPSVQVQQQQPNTFQVVAASQPATGSLASKSDRIKQVAPASGQPSGATQARFGRSFKQQQAQAQQTQPNQAQEQSSTQTSQTTNGNLPLAHYSHYSASD